MIQTFYSPLLQASAFSQIQKHLLALQRSADGWKLAEYLLQREDPTVQFFGANTYHIKIHNDWCVPSLQFCDFLVLTNSFFRSGHLSMNRVLSTLNLSSFILLYVDMN